MAVDLGPYNIRCNAVLPGYMDTEVPFGQTAADLPPNRDTALESYFPQHPGPGPNVNPPTDTGAGGDAGGYRPGGGVPVLGAKRDGRGAAL